MAAWLTILIGGSILLIGICGQCFGIRVGKRANAHDRRMGKIVLAIGSTVVGLWVVAFTVVHLLHTHAVGH
jgi:hypothetical protein